jgi:hypothetical protein
VKQYEEALSELLEDSYGFEDKWIQKMHMKKGALRKALKVKAGHDIPAYKLKKAVKSKDPTMRRRAALAATFAKMRKK